MHGSNPSQWPVRRLKNTLQPWLLGALAWGIVSLVVIGEYRASGAPGQLVAIWFLMALLWAEFGFAAMFHSLIRLNGRGLGGLLLITLVPPALLYLAVAAGWP